MFPYCYPKCRELRIRGRSFRSTSGCPTLFSRKYITGNTPPRIPTHPTRLAPLVIRVSHRSGSQGLEPGLLSVRGSGVPWVFLFFSFFLFFTQGNRNFKVLRFGCQPNLCQSQGTYQQRQLKIFGPSCTLTSIYYTVPTGGTPFYNPILDRRGPV